MELLRNYFVTVLLACLGMAILLPGSSCRTRLSLPHDPGDRREWTTAGGEEEHRGFSSERLILPLELGWQARTRGSVVASPTVIGEMVCVGTLGKRFYFFSAVDGRQQGVLKTDAGISSSAAAGEGSVYLATGADEGNVCALDLRNGEIRWKTDVGDVSAALTYHRGYLLVSTNEGLIHCLAAGDGSRRWQFTARGMRTTATAIYDGMAVCGCDGGYLYALGIEDGAERWRRQLDGAVWSRPSIADGRIYVGTFEGHLSCLETNDGEVIWQQELKGGITHPPALGGEMVFVGTDRGLVSAFDRDSGRMIWENRLNDARPGTPLVTLDALLVGGSDGLLRALSTPTGDLLWSHQVEGAIVSAPVLSQGRLYLGSMADYVYGFSSAGSEAIADSSGVDPFGDVGSPSP